MVEPAEPLDSVGLVAGGGERGGDVAVATTYQFLLDEGKVQHLPGWAAVEYTSHGGAVGFAKGGQPEGVADAIQNDCFKNRDCLLLTEDLYFASAQNAEH